MLDDLRALLGHAAVLGADELKHWRVAGVLPHAVVFPDNTEQVAAVLRQASAAQLPIEPAGAGTWLRAGRVPHAPPIVLSTTRLNGITEYEPADLTASLGAGVYIADFQNSAAEHGQCLALDAPAVRHATMGAAAATASAGPLRYAYGAPRDQVLGLELVTGDGRIVNLGGKVVKNVAGYDLTRLVVGSRGTLGVITRVNVRLRPLPARDVTFAFRGPAPDLAALSAVVCNAALEPAAVELVMAAAAEPAALYVRVQGNEATVRAAETELERSAGRAPDRLTGDDAHAVWQALNDAAALAEVSVRLAALPSESPRLLRAAQQVRNTLTQATGALHAGNGIARVQGSGVGNDAEFTRAILDARATLAGIQGSVVVVVAPPELQERVSLFPAATADVRLMRELKKVFDPAGILAPARFVV